MLAATILAVDCLAPWLRRRQEPDFPFVWLRGHDLSNWLTAVSLLVVGLAIRGMGDDPARPFWSSGATLLVCGLAVVLAVRSGSLHYVFASGLLVNLVGLMIWYAWSDPRALASLVFTQVLCFALGSLLWSAITFALLPMLRP